MYTPASFREDSPQALHGLIRACPLGTLVSQATDGLQASPLPFLVDTDTKILRAHMARANPHWKTVDAQDCLVIFMGPDAYVTPDWYPSKAATHKVVPTWNYAAVHVRGVVRIVDDPEWLTQQIADLTAAHEAARPVPWSPADAPADFIAAQQRAVIGLEITITAIEGKWKMGQNREAADRDGVVRGMGDPADPHHNPVVAALVERCSRK